jgi:hypothetical protein
MNNYSWGNFYKTKYFYKNFLTLVEIFRYFWGVVGKSGEESQIMEKNCSKGSLHIQ